MAGAAVPLVGQNAWARRRRASGTSRWNNAGRLEGICVINAAPNNNEVYVADNAHLASYTASLAKLFSFAASYERVTQHRLDLSTRITAFTPFARIGSSYQTSRRANGDFIERSVPSDLRRQFELMGTLSSNLSTRTVAGHACGVLSGAPTPIITRALELADEFVLPALAEENLLRAEAGEDRLSPRTHLINVDGTPDMRVVNGRAIGETQVTTPFELCHFIKGAVNRLGLESFTQFFGLPYVEQNGDRRGAGCILLKNNPRLHTDNRYNGVRASLSPYAHFLIDHGIIKFGKTGYIAASGNNMAVYAEYNGRSVVAVKFGGGVGADEPGGTDAANSIAGAVCEALGIDDAFLEAHARGDTSRLEYLQAQRRREFTAEDQRSLNPFGLY
ncbi:MAG: hypothetical protein GC136_08340 [Alphaproteobacteria bacterium]|nr:hypothetical protein [Alphaproteobacteria bacterium]